MKFPLSVRYSGASLVVAVSLLLLPVVRAQRRPAKPAPTTPTAQAAATEKAQQAATFDTLLSADAYGVYAEMRMVGRHAGSQEIAGIINPLTLGGAAPDELLNLYEFLKTHADALMTARLLFATMPAREGLPEMLLAVEMPSVEEAQKFVPELKQFIAANVAPPSMSAGAATTEVPSQPARRRGRRRARTQETSATTTATTMTAESAESPGAKKRPPAPAFQVKRSGRLVAMSGATFTFKNLRGTSQQPLLSDEPGFLAARSRFSADTLFIYFNTVRMNNSSRQRTEALEKEWRRQEELAQAEAQKQGGQSNSNRLIVSESGRVLAGDANLNGNMNANVAVGSVTNTNVATTPEDETPPPPPAEATPEGTPEPTPSPKSEKELEEERQRAQSVEFAQRLGSLVFGGGAAGVGGSEAWPESIGVGASLDGDALVVRGLFVNLADDQPLCPIPFLPVLLSGPSIAAAAPAVLPADTDIFVSASLDLPQMYDYLASLMKIVDLAAAKEDGKGGFSEQLTSFEKTNNFRIREELIAALGNEIAVGMSGQIWFGSRSGIVPRGADGSALPTGPVVVVALNDRESLQKLLPRVLKSIGFAGASEQNIVEKRGEVEVLTFSNGTLAFIDRFLVGTPDAAMMRRVTDAYNNGLTLANSERFRDSVNWQSRQALGQVYVSNAMLKGMFEDLTKAAQDIDDPAIRAYLTRLDPEPGSLTHLATREPNGLLHEIHVPKNLLALFAASGVVSQQLSTLRSNEGSALGRLYGLHHAQSEYKESKGRYGTLEELKAAKTGLFSYEEGDVMNTGGYEINLDVSGDGYEITATPTGYPKQGRRSFYIDQTGILRGGDLNGKPASASDPPAGY